MSETKKGKPHPHKGYPLTDLHRKKIGQAHKGKPKPLRSLEHSRRISEALGGPNNPNYGKKFSKETKQKMRTSHARSSNGRRTKGRTPWNKNKPLSIEHRKHISEARFGKKHPHKGRARKEKI
jgi:hypothetical protein